jgi:hypothetical protein
VTAKAVEAACWMSGGNLDLPEHFAAGLKPHSVSEKYYFARGQQLVNRVVDIGPTLAAKIDAIRSCKTMVKHMMKDLNDSLADCKLRLPELNADEFIKAAFVARDQANGAKHGLEYAAAFHYIGPDQTLDDYIRRNAVSA